MAKKEFKRQLLHFDKISYKKATNKLNKFVAQVNNILPLLKELEGKDISLDFIKQFTMNRDFIKNVLYKQFFDEVLKRFHIQTEFMRWENYNENSWAHEIINGRTRQYYEVRDLFEKGGTVFYTYSDPCNYFIDDNLVTIEEGKMIITDIAEEYLKEKFSEYTKNEKENEVIEKVNEIHKLIKDIDYNVLLAFAKPHQEVGYYKNWYYGYDLSKGGYFIDNRIVPYSYLRAVKVFRNSEASKEK